MAACCPESTTRRRYAIADVLTDRTLSGNPVAVVLDAEGLNASMDLI